MLRTVPSLRSTASHGWARLVWKRALTAAWRSASDNASCTRASTHKHGIASSAAAFGAQLGLEPVHVGDAVREVRHGARGSPLGHSLLGCTFQRRYRLTNACAARSLACVRDWMVCVGHAGAVMAAAMAAVLSPPAVRRAWPLRRLLWPLCQRHERTSQYDAAGNGQCTITAWQYRAFRSCIHE